MLNITQETLDKAREIGFIQGLLNTLPLHVFQWLYKRYKTKIDELDKEEWAVLLNINYSGSNHIDKYIILQSPRVWDYDLAWQVASIISELEYITEYLNIDISTPEKMYEVIEFKTRKHLTALTYIPKFYYKFSRWGKRRLKAIQKIGLEEEIKVLTLDNFYISSGQPEKAKPDAYRWCTPGEIIKIKREKERLINALQKETKVISNS